MGQAYDRTKPYNNLPDLPPPDEKVITIETLQALNNANKALAELKGLARKLPNQSMLVNTIALREAKASTEIENIFTTDDELYRSLSGSDSALTPNAKEVLRYRQALWEGYDFISKKEKVTRQLMIMLYRQIKQVNDGIRPTHTETVIKKGSGGFLDSSVVYTPPRGEKLIEKKLDKLIDYLNDDKKYPHDPLLKIVIAHYQFEAIHPFRDGNGRTGRILNSLLMVQKQLLDVPILYLSTYIIKNKDEYYKCLNDVTAHKDWGVWLAYMLKAVEETSMYTINKINEIDRLFQGILELIREKLPHMGKEVVEKLFEQPYVSPKRLISKDLKSINTAKKYLKQLEEIRILVAEKIGNETLYLNIDLFKLLSES